MFYPDHLAMPVQKWSGRVIYVVIIGPPGHLCPDHLAM